MAKWTETKPWEQQKGESSQAYEAFQIYLNMGADRSIRAVARRLGKSNALIFRWSSQKHWQDRIRAYNNYVQEKATQDAIAERRKMNERQAKLGAAFQQKAFEALQKIDDDGLKGLHPLAIKEFLRIGADVERKARTAQIDDYTGEETQGKQETSTAAYIIAAYEKRIESSDEAD